MKLKYIAMSIIIFTTIFSFTYGVNAVFNGTVYEFMDGITTIGSTMALTSESAPNILYYAFNGEEGAETLFVNLTDLNLEAYTDDIQYATTIYTLANGDLEVAYLGIPYAVVSSDSSNWIFCQKLVDEDADDGEITLLY